MEAILKTIFDNVTEGQSSAVQESVLQALQAGIDPASILNEGMIAGMREVGRRFEEGDFFVPEMLIAARAMQAGLALLKPHLQDADVKSAGKVVIGTVKGDLHDIGKNLVSMMLEGAGYEVVDLGTDVGPDKFVASIKENNADLVALSALLTTTMANMETTIQALKDAGIRPSVKVMVGGAPVTESFASKIGADGYAADASRAVAVANQLLL